VAKDKVNGFWDVLLAYHDKEPLIANIVVLIIVSTPVLLGWFGVLKIKAQEQTKKNKNILAFKLKVKDKGVKK